jgi:hypothetical protein
MRKSWLVCALLGTLAWGQAAPGAPPPAQPAPAPADTSASVAADAAVITVKGACPASAAATTAQAADCKTVITKAEFEKIASGVAPNMTPQLKKQLASVLPRFIALSEAAEKQGLDKTPQYTEMLKFAKMQILTNALQRSVQEEAAKVPPEEIEEYYKSNTQAFEQFSLDRLFVPRTKQTENDAKEDDDDKLTEAQQKAKQEAEKAKAEQGEQAMAKLAEDLRARAVAGEDFIKLQKEAFEAAGMKIESPTVTLPKVRRTGLPAAHAAVFELKVGEVSAVINDSGGHYIYKVTGKDQLTLDQAKEEIRGKLQSDRTREMMEKLNNSFKVETNEAYFGPGGAGVAPPPRMANPRMAPGPMAPMPQSQTPPSTPATKPN